MLSLTKELRDLFGFNDAAAVRSFAPAVQVVETFEEQAVEFFTSTSEHRDALDNELFRVQEALRTSTMSMLDEAKLVQFIKALQGFKADFKPASGKQVTAKITRDKSESRIRYTLEIFNDESACIARVAYFDEL